MGYIILLWHSLSLPYNYIETVSDWLIENKLSLHLYKRESILFGSKIKLKSESNWNITCRGIALNLKKVSSIKVQL